MRTTFVWRDGQLVEKSKAPPPGGVVVIGDIQEFRTTDGVLISSRSQLRAYEASRGVKQVGNDWTGPTKPTFHDAMVARANAMHR